MQVDGVFQRYCYFFEEYFVVVVGVYVQMVLVFYDMDVWVVVVYQLGIYVGDWFVVVCLYCQLGQVGNVGGVEFVFGQLLVVVDMLCQCIWQIVV